MRKFKMSFYQFIYIVFLLIVILISNLCITSMIGVLITSVFLYVVSLLYHKHVLGSWKNVIINIQFFFMTCFFIYYVMPIIVFMADGYKPRIYNFDINYNNMLETSRMYLIILSQFCLWLTIFGYPKKIKSAENMETKRIRILYKPLFDLLATICVIYFAYMFLRNGISIFNNYIRDIRSSINGVINNRYIYIYMIVYTYAYVSSFFINKKMLKSDIYRLVIIIAFWGFSVFVDRRALVLTCIMIIIVIIMQKKKFKLKSLIIVAIVGISILSVAFFREGYKINNSEFNDVLYYTTGEFTLTNYVSVYYFDRVNEGYELLNGLSYTYYPIAYLFPSFLIQDKPINLGMRFYLEAQTNTAFAFNPIAEGLINFGSASIFTTPIILALYIILTYKLEKKNYMIYILMYAYSIDYLRGMFANIVFELIVFMILFKIFCRIEEEKKNEGIVDIGNS